MRTFWFVKDVKLPGKIRQGKTIQRDNSLRESVCVEPAPVIGISIPLAPREAMEATFDPPGGGRGDSPGVPSAKVLAFIYWREGRNERTGCCFRTRVENGISYNRRLRSERRKWAWL
jgi:hypothetical protein